MKLKQSTIYDLRKLVKTKEKKHILFKRFVLFSVQQNQINKIKYINRNHKTIILHIHHTHHFQLLERIDER